jgi:hypothetical protein
MEAIIFYIVISIGSMIIGAVAYAFILKINTHGKK